MHTDYMYTMKCSRGESFCEGELVPFGNIEISPSAGVLNYGQVSFLGYESDLLYLLETIIIYIKTPKFPSGVI